MGFFETLANGAKKVGESMQKTCEEFQQYKEKYRYLDADELKEKYRSAYSMAEKGAIKEIMKEKGYM